MAAAAEIFRGFHDFASFADKRIDKNLSTQVQIDRTEVTTWHDLILFRIVGSHFLWKMVRRLVGIVVEAGRGTALPEAEIEADALTEASAIPAHYTAPPSGLFLAQVLYEGDQPVAPCLPAVSLLFLSPPEAPVARLPGARPLAARFCAGGKAGKDSAGKSLRQRNSLRIIKIL